MGPIYATGTKPDKQPQGLTWARQAADQTQIPWFAIGGINVDRLAELRSHGVTRVAVVGAIMAADDPQAASTALLSALV